MLLLQVSVPSGELAPVSPSESAESAEPGQTPAEDQHPQPQHQLLLQQGEQLGLRVQELPHRVTHPHQQEPGRPPEECRATYRGREAAARQEAGVLGKTAEADLVQEPVASSVQTYEQKLGRGPGLH